MEKSMNSHLFSKGRFLVTIGMSRSLLPCSRTSLHNKVTSKAPDSNDLTFCGFILPEQIKKLYQDKYSEDSDMTSLLNWGKFEEEHTSTFKGMYQFWAQKTS